MRNMTGTRLFSVLTAALLTHLVCGELINTQVLRSIDVSSTVVISKTEVTMQNEGTEPVSKFHVTVHCSELSGLSDLWVATGGTKAKPLKMSRASESEIPTLDKCFQVFSVQFAKALEAGKKASVVIYSDVSGAIRAIPDVIHGYEDQYMRYNGNNYFFTPYVTRSMKTVVTLGSSVVTSSEGVVEPFEIRGKKLTMGIYEDVSGLSREEMKVRFRNNRGFLVATKATKEFYVSHWGNVGVKEEFEMVNAGAEHSGEWSRADHSQVFQSKYSNVVGDVWANLPPHATNVEYKDLVGNVTTSRLRNASKKKRAIQLKFRYPMVGQWRNHFWITYDSLLNKYGASDGNEHWIDVPIFPSVHGDLLCEELTIRVLLPEGANGIKIAKHGSLEFETDLSHERRTLNFVGRPVVWLKKRMVRSESKHVRKVRIEYSYRKQLTWVTPVIVGCGIVAILGAYIGLLRTEVGLSMKEKER